MPGWQGKGRCVDPEENKTAHTYYDPTQQQRQGPHHRPLAAHNGCTPEEKRRRCEPEAVRAYQDMILLGLSDVLVLTKRSTFGVIPSVLALARNATVCTLAAPRHHIRLQGSSVRAKWEQANVSYRCFEPEPAPGEVGRVSPLASEALSQASSS